MDESYSTSFSDDLPVKEAEVELTFPSTYSYYSDSDDVPGAKDHAAAIRRTRSAPEEQRPAWEETMSSYSFYTSPQGGASGATGKESDSSRGREARKSADVSVARANNSDNSSGSHARRHEDSTAKRHEDSAADNARHENSADSEGHEDSDDTARHEESDGADSERHEDSADGAERHDISAERREDSANNEDATFVGAGVGDMIVEPRDCGSFFLCLGCVMVVALASAAVAAVAIFGDGTTGGLGSAGKCSSLTTVMLTVSLVLLLLLCHSALLSLDKWGQTLFRPSGALDFLVGSALTLAFLGWGIACVVLTYSDASLLQCKINAPAYYNLLLVVGYLCLSMCCVSFVQMCCLYQHVAGIAAEDEFDPSQPPTP